MSDSKIIVAVRKRPLSKKQLQKNESDIISVKNKQTVIISQLKQKVDLTKYIQETIFNFDYAFDQKTTNEEIYDIAVRPLIEAAFQGAKVTCFAYGQTGSGKTFTMNGNEKLGVIGLYALGANDMFSYLADPKFQHLTARLSYFQIYCGKLYDLLNKRQQLKIRQDNKSNINIIGIEQIQLYSWHQFLDYLKIGASQRITSQNSANSQSSRSHGILQISLRDGKKTYGKISFIDLAGNERGADHTDQKKQTRIDGAQINKSLLSLKECIRALDQGKSHTPFRGSKLTMVLKDSFVGFCKTVMIGNISPSSASSQNTLNTLRYADRVKELKRSGSANKESLTKQQEKARQMMLPRASNKNTIKIQIDNNDDAEDIEVKRQKAQENYGIRDKESDFFARNQSGKGHLRDPIRLQKTQNLVRPIKQPQIAQNVTRINANNQKKGNIGNMYDRRNSFNNHDIKGIPRMKNEIEIEQPPNRTQRYDSQRNKNVGVKKQEPNNYLKNMTKSQTINQINRPGGNVMENLSALNSGRGVGQRSPVKINKKKQEQNQNGFNSLIQNLQSHPEGVKNPQVSKNLHELLFKEERSLITDHGTTLRNQLQLLKSEMEMIKNIENGIQKSSTREYLTTMQQSIDDKISLLQMLREKMLQFRYHYEAVEELEQQNKFGGIEIEHNDNNMGDDQQLLDDLH